MWFNDKQFTKKSYLQQTRHHDINTIPRTIQIEVCEKFSNENF